MPSDIGWLVAHPIAHRGYHDRASGRYENTLSAARAALAAGFAIECDVQRSADGDAMVFHDFTLERLTPAAGAVADLSAKALGTLEVGGTTDRIPTLSVLLETIAGRVPLICEIKSAFDGDMRLAERVWATVEGYPGPVALKSFDPAVLAYLRLAAKDRERTLPLGIVAESRYDDPEWQQLSSAMKGELAALVHFSQTEPDFLSYAVGDLPHAAATLFRAGLRRPVIGWTVRTPAQRMRAATWADQMVFEGFEP